HDLPRRLEDHPQRFGAAAAAVAARSRRVRLQAPAQIEQRLEMLPGLDLAHVALGIPHRCASRLAVLDVLRAGSLTRQFEVREGGGLAEMVDAAALKKVPGARVGRSDFF